MEDIFNSPYHFVLYRINNSRVSMISDVKDKILLFMVIDEFTKKDTIENYDDIQFTYY